MLNASSKALPLAEGIKTQLRTRARVARVVVNVVYVQRPARRHDQERVTGDESVAPRMRLVGMFQNADPFRVAKIKVFLSPGRTVSEDDQLVTVGVESAVAIQVQAITELRHVA